MTLNNSLYMSSKDEWPTPQKLFDKLNLEFGFVLDVCASESNKKCKNYFDKQKNGLIQKWYGPAWTNPPYGRGIDKWMEKAYQSFLDGITVVCLVPVRSDTKWWHKYVMKSSEIRFLTRRLSFEGANNKAPFPAAIIVYNPKSYELKALSYEV